MTMQSRIFSAADFIKPSDGKPSRSVVLETEEAVISVWHVGPGQEITPHIHPKGQDTWTVLSGAADYYMGGGEITLLKAGQIAVACPGQVHGAFNSGAEPFVFISIVAPCNAGYELAKK